MTHVYTRIPRCPRKLVAQFTDLPVAIVGEAMDGANLFAPDFGVLVPEGKQTVSVAGQAQTALNAFGDNLAMHRLMPLLEPGDVMVLATTGVSDRALIGELMALCATRRGVSAAVVDGAIRDVAGIRRIGFPVWYRMVSARQASKNAVDGVNIPAAIGGTIVVPGDIIVADEDGVIVVPLPRAGEVLEQALQRLEHEDHLRREIEAGRTYYEIGKLHRVLDGLGVEESDLFPSLPTEASTVAPSADTERR